MLCSAQVRATRCAALPDKAHSRQERPRSLSEAKFLIERGKFVQRFAPFGLVVAFVGEHVFQQQQALLADIARGKLALLHLPTT